MSKAKMRRWVFDASLVSLRRMDGLNRYSRAVLSRIDLSRAIVIANHEVARYYRITKYIRVPRSFSEPSTKSNLARFVWHTFALPFYLILRGFPKFYTPVHEGQTIPIVRQVVTIHDVLPFHFPETFARLSWFFYFNFPLWVLGSRRIICVSEATRKDVQKRFRRCPPMEVVYEGCDVPDLTPGESDETWGAISAKLGISRYVLQVTEHRPYKNSVRGIQAFAQIPVDQNLKLVLVGKILPSMDHIRRLPKELGIEDRVVFAGFVSDRELKVLYEHALVFLFPSLYEGFGLPVLEALSSGATCATSEYSSLPEVGGDTAFYFNPYSVQSIAGALNRAIDYKTTHGEESIRRSKEQAAKFSFDDAVEKIYAVIKNA